MILERQNKTDLDPLNHRQSVKRFLSFYHIEQQKPDAAFLEKILAHFANLPYENISKIVKLQKNYLAPERIRLPEEVMEDHAAFHLGGTCFSLTYFLQAILSECGFLCYSVIAHMQRMLNAHCSLVVLLEGKKYLVDPGYLLNQPMQIHKEVSRIYRTEHTGVETVFNPDDEHFYLYTFDRTDKKFRYKFRDQPLSMQEFLKHWLDSFYWPGMRGICLTRVNRDGMVYVHNDFVQVLNGQGKKKGHVRDVHLLVKETFHIEPEWVERARAAIPEIISLGRQHGYYQK